MPQVDQSKFTALMGLWITHENWIQAGCPLSDPPQTAFPGYQVLSEQDIEGYALYRHALVPYFAAAFGFDSLHDSLTELFDDAESVDPGAFASLMAPYKNPDSRFRAQWGNLVEPVFHDGLDHQTLLGYQKKFEVELPLCLLAQVRELVSIGTFDPNLTRFRDNSGNLKKGVLAQYVIDGLRTYSGLHCALEKGYRPRLRNAVGHNTYEIVGDEFRALDSDFRISREEFSECLNALQVFQNAILWYLASAGLKREDLGTQGVVAIGWVPESVDDVGCQQLLVFQLEPFFELDSDCSWLSGITVSERDNEIATTLADSPAIRGGVFAQFPSIFEQVNSVGAVRCSVVPVMPCLHSHDVFALQDGEYCEVVDSRDLLVPLVRVT